MKLKEILTVKKKKMSEQKHMRKKNLQNKGNNF